MPAFYVLNPLLLRKITNLMRNPVKNYLLLAMTFMALCFSGCMREAPTEWNVKIGDQMPEFSIKNLNGDGEVSNSSLASQPYVVSIFATWCPPCREELLALNESVWKPLKVKGAQVVAVNYGDEDDETIRQFIAQNGLEFPVLADIAGDLRTRLGVQMVPQTVVVGPDGKILDLHVGVTAATIDAVYKELQKATVNK